MYKREREWMKHFGNKSCAFENNQTVPDHKCRLSKDIGSNTKQDSLRISWNNILTWLLAWTFQNTELTVQNYGFVWYLDHTIPCSWFIFLEEKQMRECFNWLSLRPTLVVDYFMKRKKSIFLYFIFTRNYNS